MATATKKPAAKPATQKTARKPATSKPAATKPAVKAAPERSVRTLVVDSAFATVGLTDSAVALLRALPAKAPETVKALREEAPVRVKSLRDEAPKQLGERLQALTSEGKAKVTDLRAEAEQRLDAYAGRGRQVVDKVLGSGATQRALEQTRVARAQVKAAATSVRKAVGAGTEAAEQAVETVGATA